MRMLLVLAVALFGGAAAICAQSNQNPITTAERAATVENAAQTLEKNYIFPETAQKVARLMREKLARGEYEQFKSGEKFAEQLTVDLREATRDKHLRVEFSDEILPPDQPFTFDYAPAQLAEMRKIMSKSNYGVEKIEFLPGNVGYLKINVFAPLAVASEIYSAALNVVHDTDALILDLRDNGGSLSPDTIPYFAGYFFENPVHLNDIYWCNTKETRQYWSAAQVAGRKYLEKPVYILISKNTFSGAEELAYDFKHLKRAVIVGETSGGGANPGGMRRVGDHFQMFVAFGKATNPITKTNWENAGVAPDAATKAAEALPAAYRLALEQIETRSANHPEWQQYIRSLRAKN